MSMDDRIDLTRKNIGIAPIQSEIARTNGLPGFFISFKANDPRTAQLVCGEIQSLFVSENLSDRAASAAGTTDFLKGQLADAKAKLDEQDAKLRKFQQTYIGKLPGAEASNINMLTTLNTQLDAATQALARLEQNKTYVESMACAAAAAESGRNRANMAGSTPQAQQVELQQLLAQEADLTSRYTDDYPDVVSVRRKIKELRAEDGQGAATVRLRRRQQLRPPSRPIRSERSSFARSFVRWTRRLRRRSATRHRFRRSLHLYQERVASSPEVEEEYKSITRDNQTAQAFYDDLLNKIKQPRWRRTSRSVSRASSSA